MSYGILTCPQPLHTKTSHSGLLGLSFLGAGMAWWHKREQQGLSGFMFHVKHRPAMPTLLPLN